MSKLKYWNGSQWVQVAPSLNEFGNLSSLTTNEKTNLAGAINEVDANADTNASNLTAHLAEKATLAVDAHVQHGTLSTTLDTNWTGSSAPFTKIQTVASILATDNPIIDVEMSGTFATDQTRAEAWGFIYRAVTTADTITFYATEKPLVSLPLQIKVVR